MKRFLVLGLMMALGAGCSASDSDEASSTASAQSTLSIKGSSSMTLGADTSAAKMKIYAFYVAKSADCSDPVELFADEDGKEVDMMKSPDIGSGLLDQGTYNCVIMEMSDTITFTPATTTGVCTAGTEYELDVFRPQGEDYKPTGVLPDGTEVEGAVGEQTMAVYISSLSVSEGGDPSNNAFEAPTASKTNNGIKLASPLEVTKDTIGTLVLDTSGRVESNFGTCDMQPPQFGFY